MKSFKSAVFVAVASLFLAVSLSGCKDNDAQTASQSDKVESSTFDSAKVKLVLKPESKYITIHFPTKNLAETQKLAIKSMLIENGVPVEHLVVSGDLSQGVLFVRTGQIGSQTALTLQKDNLVSFTVESSFGKVIAIWEPSFGSEVKYVS